MGLYNSLLLLFLSGPSLVPIWRTLFKDHTEMMLLRVPAVAVSIAEHEEVLGFLLPLNLLIVARAGWPPFCPAWARDSGGCLILAMAVVLSLPNDKTVRLVRLFSLLSGAGYILPELVRQDY